MRYAAIIEWVVIGAAQRSDKLEVVELFGQRYAVPMRYAPRAPEV